MEIKRIRYTRTGNVLTSNKTFNLNGRDVKVTIELENHTYKVQDVVTGEVISQGSDRSPNSVKKAAKEALQALGFVFADETRVREPKQAPAATAA